MNERIENTTGAKVPGDCCCSTRLTPEEANGSSRVGRNPLNPAGLDRAFITGAVRTPIGEVPRVSSRLAWSDHWGAFKARWGVGRMNYTVDPGLYALGTPAGDSPVLVTANYKMSFDGLRSAIAGKDVWILVLDTRGINVWCAAGKGTFGTEELVARIGSTRLAEVVSHRKLLLPQLAGPGVAAHDVKKLSGFKVTYGPVEAGDVSAFMERGLKATPEMRRKAFTMWERTVLIPVELVAILKPAAVILPLLFLLGGLGGLDDFLTNAWNHGLPAVAAFLGAIVAGAVLTPILLPWLPGRAFSVKGLVPGLFAAGILALAWSRVWPERPALLEILAWTLIVPGISAYLAMNFTGASTYTSLSGVKKEMRTAVPIQIAAVALGFVLWLGSRLTA